MGCDSSKPVITAQPKATTDPGSATETLLTRRSVDLEAVEVQVVKPENAMREVMAAPEQVTSSLPAPGHSREEPEGQPGRSNTLEQETASAIQSKQDTVSGRIEQETIPVGQSSPTLLQCGALDPSTKQSSRETGPAFVREGGLGLRDDQSSQGECKQASHPAAVYTNVPSGLGKLACPSPQRRTRSTGCDCCDETDTNPPAINKRPRGAQPGQQLEHLIQELFRAQDLNSDGFLDESELVRLNEAVADVHDSRDKEDVESKYSSLFREKLDPDGKPVPYATFRTYMLDMLDEIDRNEVAQEMIVEQFLAEARLARTVVTGDPLLVDRPKSKGCYIACFHFCPDQENALEVHA